MLLVEQGVEEMVIVLLLELQIVVMVVLVAEIQTVVLEVQVL
jgi:hypothetical protein